MIEEYLYVVVNSVDGCIASLDDLIILIFVFMVRDIFPTLVEINYATSGDADIQTVKCTSRRLS